MTALESTVHAYGVLLGTYPLAIHFMCRDSNLTICFDMSIFPYHFISEVIMCNKNILRLRINTILIFSAALWMQLNMPVNNRYSLQPMYITCDVYLVYVMLFPQCAPSTLCMLMFLTSLFVTTLPAAAVKGRWQCDARSRFAAAQHGHTHPQEVGAGSTPTLLRRRPAGTRSTRPGCCSTTNI